MSILRLKSGRTSNLCMGSKELTGKQQLLEFGDIGRLDTPRRSWASWLWVVLQRFEDDELACCLM